MSPLAQALTRLGRALWHLFLGKPQGETQTFVACRACLSLGGGELPMTMCGSCKERYRQHKTCGWTSLPDWWQPGVAVIVMGEWTEPTEIVRTKGDVAALRDKQPAGICWPINRIRPLDVH